MKENDMDRLTELCRKSLDIKLSDAASFKMQAAFSGELGKISNAPPKPVMTISEVADYLRCSPETVSAYLGDIPCFELGGKLLFRKESVEEWIKKREQNYAAEIMRSDIQRKLKFGVA